MKNRFEAIKEHFEREAAVFDKNFTRFAPHYREAISALVSALPFSRRDVIRVADLGCGTGNIAQAILEKFPFARLTCVDLSAKMISMSRAKLKAYKNVEFHVCDLRDFKFGRYDAVVSSLVMHHLEGADKGAFYRKIYDSLKKGGVFYNTDITLGSNKHLQEVFIADWVKFLRQGCSASEVRRLLKNHTKEDRPASLMRELESLGAAGFKDIDVICKWYYFCVYGGVKLRNH